MNPYVAFMLASTKLGPMIFNRFDSMEPKPGFLSGVGAHLFHFGDLDEASGTATCELLSVRRAIYGPGAVVLDIGANVGAHTVRWAKHMDGWGHVIGFEPQERVFYALAGNVALNNCFNASVHHAGVGAEACVMRIPVLNPTATVNFGGFMMKRPNLDNGCYLDETADVKIVTVDSLGLSRIDLLKIDVEGMELDVLAGARETIEKFHPPMYVEHMITGLDKIRTALPGYIFMRPENDDDNVLCVHEDDLTLKVIRGANRN